MCWETQGRIEEVLLIPLKSEDGVYLCIRGGVWLSFKDAWKTTYIRYNLCWNLKRIMNANTFRVGISDVHVSARRMLEHAVNHCVCFVHPVFKYLTSQLNAAKACVLHNVETCGPAVRGLTSHSVTPQLHRCHCTAVISLHFQAELHSSSPLWMTCPEALHPFIFRLKVRAQAQKTLWMWYRTVNKRTCTHADAKSDWVQSAQKSVCLTRFCAATQSDKSWIV